MSSSVIYHRVLVKISGEALKGKENLGYDAEAVRQIVKTLAGVLDSGVELALVVGAGNLWRGAVGKAVGMDAVSADYMGMLGTVMNAIILKDAFEANGVPCDVLTSFAMEPVGELFERSKAVKRLEEGRVVICAGGTGHPFFTTDTTAALRALEIDAEAVLKATKVDGVYTDDPMKNPAAKRYERLSYDEALKNNLKVMDSTAFSLCRDNNLPIIVFNFAESGSLAKVLSGDTSSATVVSNQPPPPQGHTS